MTSAQRRELAVDFAGLDIDGLSIDPIRPEYLIQYYASLTGRQYRQIVQTITEHAHKYVSQKYIDLWNAIGVLCALLWYPVIRNRDAYMAKLETAVDNVLDTFALIDPLKLKSKFKLHLLLHGLDDTDRFGPLLGSSTDKYESFNSVFRENSIHSNRLAPSRDISAQFARQECFKHLVSGGRWLDKEGKMHCASDLILHFYGQWPIVQDRLGLAAAHESSPGSVKLTAAKRRVHEAWTTTLASRATGDISQPSPSSIWLSADSVTSKHNNECYISSWVVASSSQDRPIIGRIASIVREENRLCAYAVLTQFEVGEARHPVTQKPCLSIAAAPAHLVRVSTQNIIFKLNVMHNCVYAQCTHSGTRLVIQEREETDLTQPETEHQPVERYTINTHSMHNVYLLEDVLPLHLLAVHPVYPMSDMRREAHNLAVKSIQTSRQKKVVERAAKKAAKLAAEIHGEADANDEAEEVQEKEERVIESEDKEHGEDPTGRGDPGGKRVQEGMGVDSDDEEQEDMVLFSDLDAEDQTSLTARKRKRAKR